MNRKEIERMSSFIFESYQNEICIEEWVLDKGIVDPDVVGKYNLPKFKLIKVITYFEKNLKLYVLASHCFCFFYRYYHFLILLALIGKSFFARSADVLQKKIIITDAPPSIKNFSNIESVDLDDVAILYYKNTSSILSLFKFSYIFDLFRIVFSVVKKVSDQKIKSSDEFSSVVLNSIDLVKLSAFCLVVCRLDRFGCDVYFDSHIQRWAYLISKLIESDKSNLVQHGFIDGNVRFKHQFGSVGSLYILSDVFKEEFFKVYDFENIYYGKASLPIDKASRVDGVFTIFMASSPVSIDMELEILNEILLLPNVNVLLKLHPKFSYANLFGDILESSNIALIGKDVFPDCDLVLVYNSFLGYEYQSIGYNVIFFEGVGAVEECLSKVHEYQSGKLTF